MVLETVPAYIRTTKGWEPYLREHPALDWMFEYEEAFDRGNAKSEPYTTWSTDDFVYTKPTGEVFAAGQASWVALLENYAPFSEHYHEPFFVILWDTPTGYSLFGGAKVYAKLLAPGEQTKTDLDGKKWDFGLSAAFHFEFVKDPTGPKGLKMKSETIYGDGLPMIAEMVKRGMVTFDQVVAQLPK